MPVLQLDPLVLAVQQVHLLPVQQVPLAVDVVRVVGQGYLDLVRLVAIRSRVVLADLEALHEAQQYRRCRALYARGFEVGGHVYDAVVDLTLCSVYD